MSVEAKRGCGYRKVGGLYLVCEGEGRGCGRIPLELVKCPTCGGGIKQARGWTWIDPATLFLAQPCVTFQDCPACPMAASRLEMMGRAGLLWVGKSFYKTPGHFNVEAGTLGISRRISAIPVEFKLGETWVFLAHPEVITGENDKGEAVMLPGVFKIFKPSKIEKIVTQSQSEDEEEMKKLAERNITPVIVPDDDPDHNPKSSSKAQDEAEL